jgi:hypothetical protein
MPTITRKITDPITWLEIKSAVTNDCYINTLCVGDEIADTLMTGEEVVLVVTV